MIFLVSVLRPVISSTAISSKYESAHGETPLPENTVTHVLENDSGAEKKGKDNVSFGDVAVTEEENICRSSEG